MNQTTQLAACISARRCSMSSFDHAACLAIDPFEGDFGDGEVTLMDKIAVSRKENECHGCGETIRKGKEIRLRTDRAHGKLETFRWCTKCCRAMARMEKDGGDSWFARGELRFRTSNTTGQTRPTDGGK